MAKKYNFKKAKTIIEEAKETLQCAELGIEEDYSCTRDTVWENGEYLIDLDTVKNIMGISGSEWGTPVITLYFKNGKKRRLPCHDDGDSDPLARPFWV